MQKNILCAVPVLHALQVKNIVKIRDSMSPETRLDIDETGVILPDDNGVDAPMFPLVYYNAAGAMYAYIFGKLATLGEPKCVFTILM